MRYLNNLLTLQASQEICLDHPSHHVNFFCEDCDVTICVVCKVTTHESRRISALPLKCKSLKEELRNCLEKTRNQRLLAKKLKTLDNFQTSFEESVHRAQKKLQCQYSVVKEQLQTIYERQCSELHEELRQFYAEKEWLKKLQVVQKNANVLLNQPYSSSFISESQILLTELKKSNKKRHHTLRKPTFVNPLNKPELFPREFQLLCDNVILGYITFDIIEESILLKPYYQDTDISKQDIGHFRPNPVHHLISSRTSLSTIPEYPADERTKVYSIENSQW